MTSEETQADLVSRLGNQLQELKAGWVVGLRPDADAMHEAKLLCEELIDALGDPTTAQPSRDVEKATLTAANHLRETGGLIRAIELTSQGGLGGDSAEMVRRLNLERAMKLLGPIGPGRLF